MGLDISYYRRIKLLAEIPVSPPEDEMDNFYDTYTLVITKNSLDFIENNFPGRAEGLKPGGYDAEQANGFRAGSYSGYNWWRERLSEFRDEDSDAFDELIEFSDCEGYIGPVVAKKLAEDFKEHAAVVCGRARCILGAQSSYWIELYAHWQAAFEAAADDGCVSFH